jgi:hypothetical protein
MSIFTSTVPCDDFKLTEKSINKLMSHLKNTFYKHYNDVIDEKYGFKSMYRISLIHKDIGIIYKNIEICTKEIFKTYLRKYNYCVKEPILILVSCFMIGLSYETFFDEKILDIYNFDIMTMLYGDIFTVEQLKNKYIEIFKSNDFAGCNHKVRQDLNMSDNRMDELLAFCKDVPKGVSYEDIVIQYTGDDTYKCYTIDEWKNLSTSIKPPSRNLSSIKPPSRNLSSIKPPSRNLSSIKPPVEGVDFPNSVWKRMPKKVTWFNVVAYDGRTIYLNKNTGEAAWNPP